MSPIKMLRRANPDILSGVYIPSWNRAGSAPLLEKLSQVDAIWRQDVTIVTRAESVVEYQQAYPWARVIAQWGANGIGEARMECLRDADKRELPRITMLDDDIQHVSLLEWVQPEDSYPRSRRYSAAVCGEYPEPEMFCRSLAAAQWTMNRVFDKFPRISYGALRNALFSQGINPNLSVAWVNKGPFPSCVLMFEVARFSMRKMPTGFYRHGEDLAMLLHNLSEGQQAAILTSAVYDQNGSVKTTIPLDPESAEGRVADLISAESYYPDIARYLRVGSRNSSGGVRRWTLNWRRWSHDHPEYRERVLTPEQVMG